MSLPTCDGLTDEGMLAQNTSNCCSFSTAARRQNDLIASFCSETLVHIVQAAVLWSISEMYTCTVLFVFDFYRVTQQC